MKKHIVFVALLLLVNFVIAQEWTVPEEESKKKSPVEASDEILQKGKELMMAQCKSCHGDPGMNNAIPLPPVNPPDFASETVQSNTEGDIFYKISEGKGAMPSFKNILSEEDRWALALYIKSLGASTPKGSEVTAGQSPVLEARLNVELDPAHEKIRVKLNADSNEGSLKGIKIGFYVKRYFGLLKFDEEVTDAEGIAIVDFPRDIPGDTFGRATLVVKTESEPLKAEAVLEKADICKPHVPINIFEKRVMWSTNDRTQWWIILTYLGVVSGVWITIFYIVFQFVKINKLGKI